MIRASIVSIFLALGVSIVPAQTRDQNWAKCKDSDPDTSIAGCTALIQSGQESTENQASAYFNRGVAYHDKKQLDASMRDLNDAIRLRPEFPAALNSRGNVYSDQGQYDQAIAAYNEALRLDPNHKLAYYNRGNAYADKAEYARAIEDFDKYLELDGSDPDGFNNRGHAYLQKGD